MANRKTRKLASDGWKCAGCGSPLFVIVDDDGNPIPEDGDAQAICADSDCHRKWSGHITYVPLTVAKSAFQAEP
jgi:hypothetical protein